jgi:hypothetical protein
MGKLTFVSILFALSMLSACEDTGPNIDTTTGPTQRPSHVNTDPYDVPSFDTIQYVDAVVYDHKDAPKMD